MRVLLAFKRNAALFGVAAITGALLSGGPARASGNPMYFLINPVVNNGRPVVFGADPRAPITVPVRTEIYHASGGVASADGMLRSRGGYFFTFLDGPVGNNMTCTQTGSTTSTCTGTATFGSSSLSNSDAGQTILLDVDGYAFDNSWYSRISEPADEVTILKRTWLGSADATPESPRKGATVTVTGKLTQPDWNSYEVDGSQQIVGYRGQTVALQFRKAGATKFNTVKTVPSTSTGELRATATATWSGEWRWSFGGSSTSAGSISGVDSVTLSRVARLTANASPEPVRRNRDVTVTGRLSKATSDAATSFTGYGWQPVKLQFRKAGSSRYKTVTTVRSDSKGYLRAVVKAGSTGYWRWVFAGDRTVAAVSAPGDHVKVTK
jgi:hypothetical protein